MNFRNRKLILLIPLLSVLVMGASLNAVSAAANITPSTASALIGVEVSFKVTGLDSGVLYSVEVGGVEVLTDLSPNTSGTLTFSVSSATAGTFLVAVYNATPSLEASATLTVTDLFATIMPYIVILVGLTLLFGIIKELKF